MPTIQVGPGSDLELQLIADAMGKSKKVVVVTGAGISTNCGIPDFRSENGLYSLIQSQYDAALKNPPWEESNTFDIDDRPKKKQRKWYYEVVAPDGKVVDVIDEETGPAKEENQCSTRSGSNPQTNSSTTIEEPRRSSRSSRITVTVSELTDLQSTDPYSVNTEAVDEKDPDPTGQPDPYCRSSHSRSTDTTSRSSTPKSTESSLTSLSSQTPELPISIASSELYLNSQNAQSTTTEDPPTQTSSIGLSRTASDTSSRTLPNLKGRDLFDSRIWSSPFETSIFYMFISSLRQKIQNITTTTETHRFIRTLRDGGRLVRNYTQNIDCLESREGLCSELGRGPGSKNRFQPKTQRARDMGLGGDDNLGGCEVVPLHGTLARLRCDLCREPTNWDQPVILDATLSGTAPDCGRCAENHNRRTSKGRRGLAIGRLRPDIVLYGEEHPHSNLISPIVTHDLGVGADVLLIMGTSLRVHGLKVMIREFAKAVHTKGGKVVFVNQTKPSESIWGEFIDFWVEMDCDEWVLDLRDRREDIWTGGSEENNKEAGPEPRKRPQCLRDDRMNGVYLTYKILDTISQAPDEYGKVAKRSSYWLSRSSRPSDVQVPSTESKKPPQKKPQTKKPRKSAPVQKPATTKPKSNKRKAETEEDRKNVAYIVAKKWEEIRKIAPSLPAPPPELTLPFKNLPTKPPSWATPFVFSNHLPNVGGSSWPLDKMSLLTHPPSGADIPIHTPKAKIAEKPVVERPVIKHGYGTRARRRLSTAETIVVDNGDITMEPEDTIVVAEDPMTPASRRIKRSCSIGALVSSSPEQWHDAPETMT